MITGAIDESNVHLLARESVNCLVKKLFMFVHLINKKKLNKIEISFG